MAIYERSEVGGALRQGEILTGIKLVKLDLDTVDTDKPRVGYEAHPLAIVLSQDCDLTQDWTARRNTADLDAPYRQLPSVLFAQVHFAEGLRGRPKSMMNSRIWERVKDNKDERYHFLEKLPASQDALGEGLGELAIDFKLYFTIPTAEVYKRVESSARRRCRLRSPYLEHLSTRFCYYQFRVALPLAHQSQSS